MNRRTIVHGPGRLLSFSALRKVRHGRAGDGRGPLLQQRCPSLPAVLPDPLQFDPLNFNSHPSANGEDWQKFSRSTKFPDVWYSCRPGLCAFPRRTGAADDRMKGVLSACTVAYSYGYVLCCCCPVQWCMAIPVRTHTVLTLTRTTVVTHLKILICIRMQMPPTTRTEQNPKQGRGLGKAPLLASAAATKINYSLVNCLSCCPPAAALLLLPSCCCPPPAAALLLLLLLPSSSSCYPPPPGATLLLLLVPQPQTKQWTAAAAANPGNNWQQQPQRHQRSANSH